MVTLKFKDGTVRRFNLNNFETEKRLRDAWYAMREETQHERKKISITMKTGEKIKPTIADIAECEVQDAEYIEVAPEDIGTIGNKKEKEKESDIDRVIRGMNESKRRKVEKLMQHLKNKGVTIEDLYRKLGRSTVDSMLDKL